MPIRDCASTVPHKIHSRTSINTLFNQYINSSLILVTITNIRTLSRCSGDSGSSGPGTLFLALYPVDHIITFLITIFLRTWHSENTWTRTEICTTSPPETSHQLKHQYITHPSIDLAYIIRDTSKDRIPKRVILHQKCKSPNSEHHR